MNFEQTIANLSTRARSVEDGDYIKNGLMYCHLCNTPKQCKLDILGKTMTVNCMCKCKCDKVKAEEEERFKRRIESNKRIALLNDNMMTWTFSNDDGMNPKLTNAMFKYCENFKQFKKEGKGLLIYGTTGTGKTYATARIVNELVERGYWCEMTTIHRIVNDLQGEFSHRNEKLDKISKYDLLVLDDLSTERKTEYMLENVYRVIDTRVSSGLPLIITTNLTADEMRNETNITLRRIYSRIFERCHPIMINGTDKRIKTAKQDFDDMKGILGL